MGLLFGGLWLSGSTAQTFTSAGAAIPDNGRVLEIPLEVNGLSAVLDTWSFGLEQVCITGLAGLQAETGELVFPNPFADHVWITTTRNLVSFRSFDMQGRAILEERLDHVGHTRRVDLPANMPSGVYTMLIRSTDGQELSHRLTH